MSVNADIVPQYIEKVVAIVPTIFGAPGDSFTIIGGRVGPVSGGYPAQDAASPPAPSASDSGGYPAPLQGTYTIKAQNLVVIYDVRYVMEPVYGHVGGGEPRELMSPIMSTCFASIVFACPACESTVVGGR